LSQWVGKADAPADEIPAVLGNPAAKTGAEMAAASPVSEAPSQVSTQSPPSPTPANAPAPAAAPATQPQSVAPPPPVAAPQVESKISVALPPKAEAVSAPKLISGAPSDADNRRGKYRGSLVVQFTIGREGRVTNCAVRRTSDDAKLDALTCRILEARTRFAPAKDAQGTAVSSVANATYVWGRGHRAKK
jgi:protein TonB